jgi:hypothetical protein
MCYWKFSLEHNSKLLQAFESRPRLTYNVSLIFWPVVSLTDAMFKPLMSFVSGLALPCFANRLILMVLYDFSLLPALENRVEIADMCASWKVANGRETLFSSSTDISSEFHVPQIHRQSNYKSLLVASVHKSGSTAVQRTRTSNSVAFSPQANLPTEQRPLVGEI